MSIEKSLEEIKSRQIRIERKMTAFEKKYEAFKRDRNNFIKDGIRKLLYDKEFVRYVKALMIQEKKFA